MTPLRARLAAALCLVGGLLVIPVAPAQAAVPPPHRPAPARTGDAVPTVPTALAVSGVRCTDAGISVGTTTPEFTAVVDDPDSGAEQLTPTFAYWPVDRPSERAELTGAPVRAGDMVRRRVTDPLANGSTYAFAVRATDTAGNSSAWSPECGFAVDTTVPRPPTVTSADYPDTGSHGGPGILGRFTFAADPGDTDVVSFRIEGGNNGIELVPAGADGTATIEYTPTRYGTHVITGYAVDRTGNRSRPAQYEFVVALTEPDVTDHDPSAGFGQPRMITFTPGMADVVTYTYWLNDGPRTTVPAGADGTATVQVTPDRVGANILHVISRTAAGQLSSDPERVLYVRTTPVISSPDFPGDGSEPPLMGQEITVVFRPGMPGVTSYVWSHAFDGEEHVVTADADGTATIRWRSQEYGALALSVRSRTEDGTESEPASVWWDLTVHNPAVTSAQYPEGRTAGGPGVTGTFVFRPARPGVTAYTYAFGDGGPKQTLAADADGTASITWTPGESDTGWRTLFVREHIGDAISHATEYRFAVGE